MSGTSLDGLDMVYATFKYKNGRWTGKLIAGKTIAYTAQMRKWLLGLEHANARELARANTDYGTYMGKKVKKWLTKTGFKPDFVCAHGQTLFHEPSLGYTFQLGAGASLAAAAGLPVVCDFRSGDVALGGQGAPLVPIGDQLLFQRYKACINLGGFANISFEKDGERVAFDICPVNIVMNELAQKLGKDFDKGGHLAKGGVVDQDLLNKLNALPFYKQKGPKSLGKEWVEKEVWPILDRKLGKANGEGKGEGNRKEKAEVEMEAEVEMDVEVEAEVEMDVEVEAEVQDLLATFVEHIAQQINRAVPAGKGKLLLTGGGAFNSFLVERIKTNGTGQIALPEPNVISFKEGFIFGFLGVLRWKEQYNCLSSVTGASKNHSGGSIYL